MGFTWEILVFMFPATWGDKNREGNEKGVTRIWFVDHIRSIPAWLCLRKIGTSNFLFFIVMVSFSFTMFGAQTIVQTEPNVGRFSALTLIAHKWCPCAGSFKDEWNHPCICCWPSLHSSRLIDDIYIYVYSWILWIHGTVEVALVYLPSGYLA